jgi:ABC-2 type transport system ATP-binding protein
VYVDLTVRENLGYFAAIVGANQKAIDRVLHQVDLTPQANQIVQQLSGGQLARVSLAVAILGDARLLVLDEPTVGLDPLLRRDLWKLFAELADEGRTLLISSHVMDEAESCTDLLLLRDGKVLSHGSKKELLTKTKSSSVEQAFLVLVEGGSHAS